MKTLSVGIIGTGFGGTVHAPILQLHPGMEVKSIASVHRQRTEDRSWNGIPYYRNWRDMLESESLDLVSIVSAPVHHYEMTMLALQSGHHVLTEKPLGMNTGQTLQMWRESERVGRQAFVNFQWRWTPIRQRIKHMLQGKELGDIQHIKYTGSFSGYSVLSNSYRGWEARSEDGGGFLFAIGSHMVDSLLWWMNEEITEVYGDLRTQVPAYNGDAGLEFRGAEDAFTFTGCFKGGASLLADVFFPGIRGAGWTLEIYGTKGTLVMRNDHSLECSFGGAFESIPIDPFDPPANLEAPAVPYYNGFYQMIDGIYQSITSNKSTSDMPDFADGHKVQAVLDAIRLSSVTHSRVSVDYGFMIRNG
ncbi:Gfo/Idh/MocA family protein [Paenibacillus lautus]|uniref:Gfo/Idh/MocA family protein n=1 Tax=Paenibacillus lautus TaxID=1401 RepID=UPI001C0F8399|nr:Gfo/Idh/MocA family oxidoreductase [Paenibacillus lautus]MBU5346415.1 Gfo/Idh/MocA family oxidoreductase [Paenibacillus lautus]